MAKKKKKIQKKVVARKPGKIQVIQGDYGWSVKRKGASRAHRAQLTKKEAVSYAKKISKNRDEEFEVKQKRKKSLPKPKATSTKKKVSRYNKVQTLLSKYYKGKEVSPGPLFHKQASEIYRRTLEQDLSFISKNFEAYYEEVIEPAKVKREFPNSFPFYQFTDTVLSVLFEGVIIGVKFKDGEIDISQKGYAEMMDDWFKTSTLYSHLRRNYDSSPVAVFVLRKTDGITFADYEIVTSEEEVTSAEVVELPAPAPAPESLKDQPQVTTSAKQELQSQIELEKIRSQNIQKNLELIREKTAYIQSLRDLGMSNEQIREELRKIGG